MSDIVDIAATIEAEHLARSLASIARTIPAGVAGECEACGEEMPRLIDGRCGFCRDGRMPPPGFYADRDAPRRPVPQPKEEKTMPAVIPSRKIMFNGPALKAIEQRADADDITFTQAAAELIELAIAAPSDEPLTVYSSPAGVLSVCDVDELFDELKERFTYAASVRDLEADLQGMTGRAIAAEAKLATLKAALLGDDA